MLAARTANPLDHASVTRKRIACDTGHSADDALAAMCSGSHGQSPPRETTTRNRKVIMFDSKKIITVALTVAALGVGSLAAASSAYAGGGWHGHHHHFFRPHIVVPTYDCGWRWVSHYGFLKKKWVCGY
jgi:hypothetical protein